MKRLRLIFAAATQLYALYLIIGWVIKFLSLFDPALLVFFGIAGSFALIQFEVEFTPD